MISRAFVRPMLPRRAWSRLTDLVVFAAVLAVFLGLLNLGQTWLGPVQPAAKLSRSPWALPAYAAASLARIGIAYALGLLFALAYGYAVARSPRAQRVLVPLLDILQSTPVLRFPPGVMLTMMALYPRRHLGIELG